MQEGGPNGILVAGGVLLSTLSIRLCYKLKQFLDTTQTSHSLIGSSNVVEVKQNSDGQMMSEPAISLPLVTVPTFVFKGENGVMWSSSPDRLELPQKPFHHSNSSDSPCVSESGSNIFSKREVIQKLRQQLKKRDDMILEMQNQIAELQNSHSVQLSHSSHLQSLLDAANRDLFDSDREIQPLRRQSQIVVLGTSALARSLLPFPLGQLSGRMVIQMDSRKWKEIGNGQRKPDGREKGLNF